MKYISVKNILYLFVILLSTASFQAYAGYARCKLLRSLSTIDTKNYLITESIEGYKNKHGNCPCPYSPDAAGQECGDRSAYVRPGGIKPYCYTADISDFDMIQIVQDACHPCDKWHSMPAVEIQKIMINKSIKNYKETIGDCPCPYSLDNSGQPCGALSAYSQPGGDKPYCYVSDINVIKIAEFINAMCQNLEN